MVTSPVHRPQVRCRQIGAPDLEAVAELLARGFPAKPRKYWTRALAALAGRERPAETPQFGYLLEVDGRIVGVQLLIFSAVGGEVRCNVSSWYVEPEHRGHAALLASMASRLKHVTYVNTSAAEHTWPILGPLGYRRYSQGQFAALPALSLRGRGPVIPLSEDPAHLAMPDYPLVRAHAESGCLVLVARTPRGLAPFVFVRRPVDYLPGGAAQLVYCQGTDSFVANAGALGWSLLGRGVALVICDADGPVRGLPGLFFRNRGPRFYKGPRQPRLNDLAFTEMVLFGP